MAHEIKPNLKYTDDHEWALLAGDVLTFGITDFAQSSLGDIVFVEFPEIGSMLEKGIPCGVIESIKSVNDLFSPASGEVLEVNENVSDSPENINQNAFASWLVKIKITNKSEIDQLMNADEYKVHCEKIS